METKKTNEILFVGKPFGPEVAGESGSFYPAYQEVNNDENFLEFKQSNELDDNDSSLIIFGPESYQYWQGTIYQGTASIPSGFFKYQLPKSDIAEAKSIQNESYFSQPLNFAIPTLLEDAKKAGIEIPTNLGLSQNPFVLNVLDQKTGELTNTIYLGDEIEDVDD